MNKEIQSKKIMAYVLLGLGLISLLAIIILAIKLLGVVVVLTKIPTEDFSLKMSFFATLMVLITITTMIILSIFSGLCSKRGGKILKSIREDKHGNKDQHPNTQR